MIIFKSIRIEGFGSITEPLSYLLDPPGVNIISGRNGAGKSTIFSALSWCLYGKSLKDTSDVLSWKNIKGCRVDVFLSHPVFGGVIITRTHAYKEKLSDNRVGGSRIFIVVGGQPKQDLRDKNQMQDFIVNLLGLSFKLFKNSIVFGQKLTRLMAETGPRQKEVFDEAFTVSYINTAREAASKEYQDWTKKCKLLETKIAKYQTEARHIENKLDIYEDQKVELEKVGKDLESQRILFKAKKVDKEKEQKDVEGLKTKIADLKERLSESKELEQLHFKADFRMSSLEADRKAIIQDAREASLNRSRKNPICPTCGRTLDDIEKLSLQKDDLKTKIDDLDLRLIKSRKTVTALELKLKKFIPLRKLLLKAESELSLKNSTAALVNEYKATILKLSVDLKANDEKLKGLNQKIREHKKELTRLNAKVMDRKGMLAVYEKKKDLRAWLVNDPLSNKGLKAFIFDSRLEHINKRLEEYGKYLGYTVEFAIDLDSANKNFIAIIDGTKEYETLSGGEKQLVDVSLAFAIHDVAVEQRCNLLMMDELFESLDVENIEKVSDLLTLKSKNISLHIITHQKTLRVSNTAQKVTLLKTRKKGTFIE